MNSLETTSRTDGTLPASWFAIQTKPRGEAIAEQSVASLQVETFLPQARRERLIHGVTRPVVSALFPGYLFARFCPAHSLHSIRYSRGVCRVVSAGLVPIPVEDQIISEIFARVGGDGYVQLDERPWRPGDPVEIDKGPLQGWSGVFERELPDRQRVVLLLQAIQQARVVVERRCLRCDS